jgi:ABC-type antimicrobial peptide transport system permease subunit
MAVLFVSLGLYGLVSYSVARRAGEIGLRMALGARPLTICSLVLGQGARLTLLGLGIGLVVVILLAPTLRWLLGGIPTTDVVPYAGVGLLLCLTALLASFIPARKAAAGDPATALRHD